MRFLGCLNALKYYCKWQILNTKLWLITKQGERLYCRICGINSYFSFDFASKIDLKTTLKYYLDKNVDEKFYLSQKALKSFSAKNERSNLKQSYIKVIGNIGSRQIAGLIYDVSDIAPCILRTSCTSGDNVPKIINRARGFNKGGEFSISPTINANSYAHNNALINGENIDA